jgi:pyroglutamyl-peptidase
MSETFLVTGFEPFGEHRTNSSWEAIRRLRSGWPEDIVSLELPVDHRLAHELLRQTLDERAPHAVLCPGLAKGNVFRVEHNARRPSMLGDASEQERLEGRWPWLEMHAALGQTGVQVIDSHDAGQYVCESTYWSLLAYAGNARPPEFAAFLHVPHESDDNPLDRIAAAVDSVVRARHASFTSPPSRRGASRLGQGT